MYNNKNRSIRMSDKNYEFIKATCKSEHKTQPELMDIILQLYKREQAKIDNNEDYVLYMEISTLKEIIEHKDKEINVWQKKTHILKTELKKHIKDEYRHKEDVDQLKIELALEKLSK